MDAEELAGAIGLLGENLESTFSRVGVIKLDQLKEKADQVNFPSEMIQKLCSLIGIDQEETFHQELPVVVVLEKLNQLKDNPSLLQKDESTPMPGKLETYTGSEAESSKLEACVVASEKPVSKGRLDISFADMCMIKITPNGYVGGIIDRHLVYIIEDQQHVLNLSSEHNRPIRLAQVSRRFSDFVAVRNYLLGKYPFRCVPKLPPKRVQLLSDEAFLADRQRGLRRFLGIVCKHPSYQGDQLVQAFLYNQREFNNLIGDEKFVTFDREHMLVTQIPTADALIAANADQELIQKIQNSQTDVQHMMLFTRFVAEQIQSMMRVLTMEADVLAKLAEQVDKSDHLTSCMCLDGCEECQQEGRQRLSVAREFHSIHEAISESAMYEFSDISERLNLLHDLFESYSELYVRMQNQKFAGFDLLQNEISFIEREIERRCEVGDAEVDEGITRLNHRLDAIKKEWNDQETFNKFIQFSVLEEFKWMHAHKVFTTRLLEQAAQILSLQCNPQESRQ